MKKLQIKPLNTRHILLGGLTCGLLFGAFLPIYYLLAKGLSGDWEKIKALLFTFEMLQLLSNTFLLSIGVLFSSLILAFPSAYILSRYEVPFKALWRIACILPLAVPGYIMALGWLSLTGYNGALFYVFGWQIPRPSGYFGAWIALTTTLYPYLLLNLNAALNGVNLSLEENAKMLGIGNWKRFTKVLLPQLKPALYSGSLLLFLHVLGDFGVVSLMRFKTFSYALFLQYEASFDRIYAAWLALFMVVLTIVLLLLEKNSIRKLTINQNKAKRIKSPKPLSFQAKIGVYLWFLLQVFVTLLLPLFAISAWFFRNLKSDIWNHWLTALPNTLAVSLCSTFLATVLAFGFAYFASRDHSGWGKRNPVVLFAIYSTPPLALGLALTFFSLKLAPFLYQTLFLLIGAYVLHFMAEAFGPLRSALFQVPVQLEEASKILGRKRGYTLRKVVLPLMKKPIFSALILVFLAVLKELPLTLLLAPAGFETLSMNVWSYTSSVNYGAAAPFALTIVLLSMLFVGILDE